MGIIIIIIIIKELIYVAKCQSLVYLPLGHLCHAPPLQNPKYASDVNMPSQTK